jgi:hypothetical protein
LRGPQTFDGKAIDASLNSNFVEMCIRPMYFRSQGIACLVDGRNLDLNQINFGRSFSFAYNDIEIPEIDKGVLLSAGFLEEDFNMGASNIG